MKVWIVGRYVGPEGRWQFQGVFAEEAKALAACRDESYFVGPAMLDQEIPHDGGEWPGAYYPKAIAAA